MGIREIDAEQKICQNLVDYYQTPMYSNETMMGCVSSGYENMTEEERIEYKSNQTKARNYICLEEELLNESIDSINVRHAQKYDAVYYDSQNKVHFVDPDTISSIPSDYQKLGVVSFVDNDGKIGILPANAASVTTAAMMDVYIWKITEKSTATGWMTDGNQHTSTVKLNNYTSQTAFTWQTSTLSDFSTTFNTYLTTYMNGSSFSGLEYHTYTDSDNVFLVLDTYSANPANNDTQYFTLTPDNMDEIAGNVNCPAPYLECGQQKFGLWNFNRFSVWGLNNQSSTSYSPKTNINPSNLPTYPIVYPAYIGQSWCDDGTQVKTENNNWVDYASDLRAAYGEGMEGWYNYLHAMEIDDDSTLGARQPQFVDSVANTNNLTSGTYIDKNGVEQSRYPAIMKVYNYGFAGVEGCESGDWGMMSLGEAHKYLGEIKYGYGGTGSSDRTIDPINATLYKMGGDAISCAVYRWLSSRNSGNYSWYSGANGFVSSSNFFSSFGFLPVLLYQER